MSAPVPRVASSLDDLRVGQVVRFVVRDDTRPLTPKTLEEGQQWMRMRRGVALILSEPAVVTGETFDRLADLVDRERAEWRSQGQRGSLLFLAGALVDEVRGRA